MNIVVADDVFGIVGSVQAEVFRVTAVVAEGGFAVVHRAHHQGFRADVALKCIKVPARLSNEQRAMFLRKFEEEGELLFRLSAAMPPIVRPLHVGVLDSPRAEFVPFIALEWLDGESLSDVIRRRREAGRAPLDLARAVKLLGPVARALERAHAFPAPEGKVSVIHCDLKPDNLFIAKIHGQEQIKILDFGFSKIKSEAAEVAAQSSSLHDAPSAFTPAYGAPEQWLPKRFGQAGSWTDVWGLALTLVEAIAGKQPLEGDMHGLLSACVDERKRPTPRSFGIVLPDTIEELFARALAVEPRQRFANVSEFWDPLEAAVGVHTPRFGGTSSALESIVPPVEYETTLPGLGFAHSPLLSSELFTDSASSAIPDLELELIALDERSHKRTLMHRPSELPLLGNEIPLSAIREVKLIEPVRTALEVDTSLPVPSRRRAQPLPAESAGRPMNALISRLGNPIRLIVLSVVLMLADFVYLTIVGEAVTFGPVRVFWVAGPLAGVGLIWLLKSLIDGAG